MVSSYLVCRPLSLLIITETTATTMSFAFWELAKQPHIQSILRKEVREFYRAALDSGEESIPVGEYEKMEYTQNFMKVCCRVGFHSEENSSEEQHEGNLPVYNLVPLQARQAGKDVAVPLSEPIRGKDGRQMAEIPLKRGTRVLLSVTQYNRDTHIYPFICVDMTHQSLMFI